MLLESKKNYCDSTGKFSLCTAAADQWLECLYSEKHPYFKDCTFRMDMGELVHCRSIDAQQGTAL